MLDRAERMMRFTVQQVVEIAGHCPYQFELIDHSPYNPDLLSEAGGLTKDASDPNKPFPVRARCVRIAAETPTVKTFRFILPSNFKWNPGQYATFSIDIGDGSGELIRSWSISDVPLSKQGDNHLEISVKRKPGGLISNWLHDSLLEGQSIKLLGIDGAFTVAPSFDDWFAGNAHHDKFLFLSGGVGIVPLMAMLRGLRASGNQSNVIFVHSEKTVEEIPYAPELEKRGTEDKNLELHIALTGLKPTDATPSFANRPVFRHRINSELIMECVHDLADRRAYVCGPEIFITSVVQLLGQLGCKKIEIERFDF